MPESAMTDYVVYDGVMMAELKFLLVDGNPVVGTGCEEVPCFPENFLDSS